jgi:hypothetical protein
MSRIMACFNNGTLVASGSIRPGTQSTPGSIRLSSPPAMGAR